MISIMVSKSRTVSFKARSTPANGQEEHALITLEKIIEKMWKCSKSNNGSVYYQARSLCGPPNGQPPAGLACFFKVAGTISDERSI